MTTNIRFKVDLTPGGMDGAIKDVIVAGLASKVEHDGQAFDGKVDFW